MILLAENLKNVAKCEHRVCRVKRKWAEPKPISQTERANTQDKKSCMFALFSVSEVFAVAKVKLCDTQ